MRPLFWRKEANFIVIAGVNICPSIVNVVFCRLSFIFPVTSQNPWFGASISEQSRPLNPIYKLVAQKWWLFVSLFLTDIISCGPLFLLFCCLFVSWGNESDRNTKLLSACLFLDSRLGHWNLLDWIGRWFPILFGVLNPISISSCFLF